MVRTLFLITTEVTQYQMWKLFSDVTNWHQRDEGIEYAKLTGEFEKGNAIALKPKGAPEVKSESGVAGSSALQIFS